MNLVSGSLRNSYVKGYGSSLICHFSTGMTISNLPPTRGTGARTRDKKSQISACRDLRSLQMEHRVTKHYTRVMPNV